MNPYSEETLAGALRHLGKTLERIEEWQRRLVEREDIQNKVLCALSSQIVWRRVKCSEVLGPTPTHEDPQIAEALNALARSQMELARAVRQQSAMQEILVEAMPVTVEAKILGISARTVRRRREQRKMDRLLVTSA